jgi:hypothetical protein
MRTVLRSIRAVILASGLAAICLNAAPRDVFGQQTPVVDPRSLPNEPELTLLDYQQTVDSDGQETEYPGRLVGYQSPAFRLASATAGSSAYSTYGRQPAPMQPMPPTQPMAPRTIQPTPVYSDDTSESSDCASCDLSGYRSPLAGGRGSFFAGAEFILARPHFSEATAYIRRTGPVVVGNTQTAIDEWVYYNFDYEASTRAYFGYRLCDCCAEMRFTYWNLDNSDSKSEFGTANSTPTFFEVQPSPGDTLRSNVNVGGNIYDFDFSRCIRLGDECQTCDSCPRWDLRWSAGVRVADMGYDQHVDTTDPTDGQVDVLMDFVGAGPRVGLEGRRYLGDFGQFSLYSTLDVSLLLGQYDHELTRTTTPGGVSPTTIEQFQHHTTRLIPVTEIELGASWSPAPRWTLSAGWLFQAWWDLGMAAQQSSDLLGARYHLDDSNIMSWDGLTARAEFVF